MNSNFSETTRDMQKNNKSKNSDKSSVHGEVVPGSDAYHMKGMGPPLVSNSEGNGVGMHVSNTSGATTTISAIALEGTETAKHMQSSSASTAPANSSVKTVTPNSATNNSFATPASRVHNMETPNNTSPHASTPVGSGNPAAMPAGTGMSYQSPAVHPGHSFMHYPNNSNAAYNSNGIGNSQPTGSGTMHGNTDQMTHHASSRPNVGAGQDQQQWRHYNPIDTPNYSHPQDQSRGHGPPGAHPNMQMPPNPHGHQMIHAPMGSPYAMHGPHAPNHQMAPGPIHENIHIHEHQHAPGHHNPPLNYYDSYGMPPGGYYPNPGPGMNGMMGPPNAGGPHGTNEVGRVPQMHENGPSDPNTRPGFQLPQSSPNTGAAVAGQKRSIDDAMESGLENKKQYSSSARTNLNTSSIASTGQAHPPFKSPELGVNGQDHLQKKLDDDTGPKDVTNHANTHLVTANTNTEGQGNKDSTQFQDMNGAHQFSKSDSAGVDLILATAKNHVPSTPASGAHGPRVTTGYPVATHGSVSAGGMNTTPMSNYTPRYHERAPEMYDPYYSGPPSGPGGHYGSGPGAPQMGAWQHGSVGTPGPPMGFSGPVQHSPHGSAAPPQGHGPPPPGVYYDRPHEGDTSMHNAPPGVGPAEYDRNMYYSSYGHFGTSAHGGPSSAPPSNDGRAQPHTPYTASHSLEISEKKSYVTPESRVHGSPHGSSAPSPKPSPVDSEEGAYTKILKSKGARLTDRKKLQNKAWFDRYEELKDYEEEYGDCLVPQKYLPSASLGTWVNKQRMEYKLLMDNQKSSMTTERLRALQMIGFTWAKRKGQATWDAKFQQLREYKISNGDCLIPTKYCKDLALGRWVSTQREQYRLWKEGDPKSKMNQERASKLEQVGFVWRLQF